MASCMQAASLLLVVAIGRVGGQSGSADCPCIENVLTWPSTSAIAEYRQGDLFVLTPPGSTLKDYYPLTYGSGTCKTHDAGLPPSCFGSSTPGWCAMKWCYVDPKNCTGVSKISTRFFPIVENLYFSYATCAGGSSTNTVASWSAQDTQSGQKVIEIIEEYGRTARFTLENIAGNVNTSSTCPAAGREMCPCSDCMHNTIWQNKMDFLNTGFLPGHSGTAAEQVRAQCLSEGVSQAYKTAAAKEADGSFRHVGFSYYGDQATGAYTSWPREDFCPAKSVGWDPRARPWYAAGATGPKDVIIIADVSGSMGTADRHILAKNAVMSILDTLTWRDFATVILFNDDIQAVYSEELRPMTDANRDAMKTWCGRQSWKGGGTNFSAPLRRAAQILGSSVAVGATSMCQKAVMFLTGSVDPTFGLSEDYASVRSMSKTYDAVLFTYSLGSDADTLKVKKLACENRGVFYPVPDNADLGGIMSAYIKYFAYGQEMCSASFLSYTSATGGQTLLAGCMAAYDRTGPNPDLLGVTCMDTNLLSDVGQWNATAGWPFFVCTASDMTKQCRQLDLKECHRQKIRAAHSAQSVCNIDSEQQTYSTATASTVCPCRDQGCQDDPAFRDEKGYFCDTWVGDDCTNPNTRWGYSAKGLAQIREKCPRSCSRCEWSFGACARRECPAIPIATECRACLGRTSGVDIEQNPMACPPGAPRGIAPTDPPTASKAVAPGCAVSLLALAMAAAARS